MSNHGARFFNLTEKGSLGRPTITALIMWIVICIPLTMIFFHDYPFFWLLFIPIEYLICAFLFSNPIRVFLSKTFFDLRGERIISVSSKREDKWLEINREKLEEYDIKIFTGIEPKDND